MGVADFRDSQQRVVGRMVEPPRVEQRLVFAVEERRQPRALMLEHVVRALAQCVPEQDRQFEEVALIVGEILARVRPFLLIWLLDTGLRWVRLSAFRWPSTPS